MGHSWFMLANIAQCYVSFSCTETWMCCTYDFTLIVSLSHTSLFSVSYVNSVFLPHFFTLGFSNIPLSIHTLSLRTLIQPQTIKCPLNPLGHSLDISMSTSPELQADVPRCHSLSQSGCLPHVSPVNTKCLTQPRSHSQDDSVLSQNHLRFVRSCIVQSSWSSFLHIPI